MAFKITQNKFVYIKKLYESGINLFYITSDIQSVKSVVYSGLFKIYEARREEILPESGIGITTSISCNKFG